MFFKNISNLRTNVLQTKNLDWNEKLIKNDGQKPYSSISFNPLAEANGNLDT